MKIGFIGAGTWATPYALSTGATSATVAGIYAPDASATALADQINAPVFKDAQSLVEASDCLLIGSPTDSHAEYINMAEGAGKASLCASPAVADTKDLEKLQNLATDSRSFSSFPLRARGEYARLKKAVSSGDLGNIGIYRFGMCLPRPTGWRADAGRSGGLILETGVHLIDWLEWVAGPIARIYGAASSSAGHEYTLLVAKLAEGSIAHLELSWTEPAGVAYDYYEVAGSNGLLEYDSRTAPEMIVEPLDGCAPHVIVPGATTAQRELQGLLNKIQGGTGGFTTLNHGINVCQKALRIRSGIENGEVVLL